MAHFLKGYRMKRKPIRKKSNKRKAKQKLDLELKQAIHERDGWVCVVPEEKYGKHGGSLQAAHINSKGRWPNLRHIPENLVSACWRHHFHWMHKEPLEVADWWRTTYPDRAKLLNQLKGIEQ